MTNKWRLSRGHTIFDRCEERVKLHSVCSLVGPVCVSLRTVAYLIAGI